MAKYILSQVSVVLSIICLAITYMTVNKKLILFFSCLEAVFYALQYFFLEETTGAILNLFGVVRSLLFYRDYIKHQKSRVFSLIFICALCVVIGIATYTYWGDVLALIATLVFTIAIWLPNVLHYRIISIFNSVIWLYYNIVCHSVLGVALEFVLYVIELVMAIKLMRQKKEDKVEI